MPSMLFTYFSPIFFLLFWNSYSLLRFFLVFILVHTVFAIVRHWNSEIVQLIWPLIIRKKKNRFVSCVRYNIHPYNSKWLTMTNCTHFTYAKWWQKLIRNAFTHKCNADSQRLSKIICQYGEHRRKNMQELLHFYLCS